MAALVRSRYTSLRPSILRSCHHLAVGATTPTGVANTCPVSAGPPPMAHSRSTVAHIASNPLPLSALTMRPHPSCEPPQTILPAAHPCGDQIAGMTCDQRILLHVGTSPLDVSKPSMRWMATRLARRGALGEWAHATKRGRYVRPLQPTEHWRQRPLHSPLHRRYPRISVDGMAEIVATGGCALARGWGASFPPI